MKKQLLLIASLFSYVACMENKDAKNQESNPEFIMLDSRDTIVEDLTIPDNGDIFGWATYRNHDQDYGDMCDYIKTDYSPKVEKKE